MEWPSGRPQMEQYSGPSRISSTIGGSYRRLAPRRAPYDGDSSLCRHDRQLLAPVGEQAAIDLLVFGRHPVGRKPLDRTPPDLPSVQLAYLFERQQAFIDIVDEEAADAV